MFDTNRRNIFIAAALALGFLGYWFIRSNTNAPTRSVTTIGVGKKQVPADKATITFTVSSTGSDQNALVTEGERKMNTIIQSMGGFSPTNVRKTAYQVSAVSSNSYQYASGAQITVSALNVEPAVKSITASGGSIASLRYNTADNSSAGQEAREMAIQDARTRAEQIAHASGARIGKVLVVSEQGATDQTGSSVTGTKSGLDSSSFNEVEVQSALSVTFELR